MPKRRMGKKTTRSAGRLQKMGGKEERVSKVGRARKRAEEGESLGERRFDIAPGPSTDELLQGPKGPRQARPGRKVSRKPRAEPGQMESEDASTSGQGGSLEEKIRRQPEEQTPFDPDEPPESGEVRE